MPLELPSEFYNNIDLVLNNLSFEPIDVYRFLSDRYCVSDPASDNIFQFVFKSFYRLDGAGLTDEFKAEYFNLMAQAKEAGSVDISTIVKTLEKFPNKKGQKSLQFSFVTKLAATVDSCLPIYDSKVASLFGFRSPYHGQSYEKKLEKYLAFYEDLVTFYDSMIDTNKLKDAIDAFRSKFDAEPSKISDHKSLDFIFWSAGKVGLVRK